MRCSSQKGECWPRLLSGGQDELVLLANLVPGPGPCPQLFGPRSVEPETKSVRRGLPAQGARRA